MRLHARTMNKIFYLDCGCARSITLCFAAGAVGAAGAVFRHTHALTHTFFLLKNANVLSYQLGLGIGLGLESGLGSRLRL